VEGNGEFRTYIPRDNRVLGCAPFIEHMVELWMAHPTWVIWKVTSSGPGVLLQQTEETWVFSHDESLFTDMENLWHSSLAEPNKKKQASREKEPKKFPTGTCAWIWWAPTALSHHVLHILCNPLGTLQIISPTSKACYRVELLLSTILSMFVTNMDLSWNFALFTF
jgi:hypothetical protein